MQNLRSLLMRSLSSLFCRRQNREGARNTTAPCGRNRECELAQRSKLCEVNSEQTILGTASGLNVIFCQKCSFKRGNNILQRQRWWVVLFRFFYGRIEQYFIIPVCLQTGMIGFALHLTYRGFYCIFSIRQNEQIYNQNKKIQRDFTKLKVK